MDVVDTIAALRSRLTPERRAGRRIALVPTMGALHEGHLALVDEARVRGDVVVMSLFVNPLQFLPGEDLARYPRPFARDRELAAGRGVGVLFAPTHEEMYGTDTEIRVTAGDTASRWEGAARPGHVTGVLTIVAKLFNVVQPDVAVFGQKDIQQVAVIRRMVRELDFPIDIRVVPIIRERDGLAMSSRNVYLGTDERESALALHRGLQAAVARWRAGERDAAVLHDAVAAVLAGSRGVVADYIAVVDPARLAPVARAERGTVVAIAARVGATRLIDNVILGEEAD